MKILMTADTVGGVWTYAVELAAALAQAKRRKCPVLVAKLDRLSRDVAFIAGLMA